MADKWVSDVKINELGVDEDTGEYVLVTNGVCGHCVEAEAKPHPAGGCRFVPFEGLVFEKDGDLLKSWSMKFIVTRRLRKATPTTTNYVMGWYEMRLEEIARGDRKKPKKE